MVDELNWFAATGIALALLYGAVFVFHVLRSPAVREEANLSEIDRLKSVVSAAEKGSAPSFDLFLDEIETLDPTVGWNQDAHEPRKICRLGITNIDDIAVEGCRIVVESVAPQTPVAAGTLIADDFRVSSTETKFFELLLTDSYGGPGVGFSGGESTWHILVSENRKLPAGCTYSICVAVHGVDANTRRLQFQCRVEEGAFEIIDRAAFARTGETSGAR